jgi:fibronectin type 3 domain-containing protein
LRRGSFIPIAVLAVLLLGTAGVIFLWVRDNQTTHYVDLKWDPPPPATPGSNAAAYDIYRGTRSGGPYQKINSGATTPNYTDRNVSRRQTYYYVVKTVDTMGRDSAPSNEVAVSIP